MALALGDLTLIGCLAKCFVMALLYLKDPLPAKDLELWVKSDSLK
jgi:transcription initiation factor TFIIH subunit 4